MKITTLSAVAILIIFLLIICFIRNGPEQIPHTIGPGSHEPNVVVVAPAERPNLNMRHDSRAVYGILDKLGPGIKDLEVAVMLLKEHKDDLVASTIIMEWLMEQNPTQGISEIAGIYDKVNPAIEAAFRSFSMRHLEQAWDLLSNTEDWKSRVMLTGMFAGMVENASPEKISSFLNACNSTTFGTFLPQALSKLAPEGGISKLKVGIDLIESAKERGLDVNQSVLSVCPELFDMIRSEGVVKVQEAAAVISDSTLRFNPEAMDAFAEAYVKSDPQLAFEFVGKLPEETRAPAVEAAARTLARTDPASAIDLAFNGLLTVQDRKTVMFQVHFAVAGPNGNYELFEKTGAWLRSNDVDVSKLDDRAGRPPVPINK